MEIMVTGGAGFAGRATIEALLRGTDAHITAVARGNTSRLAPLQERYGQRLAVEIIDIATDLSSLARVVTNTKPQTIFHLAAVPKTKGRREDTLFNNNGATRNVLVAARLLDDVHVIAATSSRVYGDKEDEVREIDPLESVASFSGLDPYAHSKRIDVKLIEEFRDSGMRITETRPFNHTGPDQNYGLYYGLIRDAVATESGKRLWKPEVINGAYARDVQHVENWADANVLFALTEQSTPYNIFNISSGRAITLVDFIDRVSGVVGVEYEIGSSGQTLSEGVPLTVTGNNERLQETGWRPQRDMEQLIAETADFLRTSVSVA